MKAALLQAIRTPVSIETVPDPDYPRDGVIVGVRACGICRSDLTHGMARTRISSYRTLWGMSWLARPSMSGRTARPSDAAIGSRPPFILSCGRCEDCSSGHPTICEDQHVIGFNRLGAEFVAIPNADFNLVRLPDALGYVEAAGMGCRVTPAWRGLADHGSLPPGEWLAVHGCGGVGLSAISGSV